MNNPTAAKRGRKPTSPDAPVTVYVVLVGDRNKPADEQAAWLTKGDADTWAREGMPKRDDYPTHKAWMEARQAYRGRTHYRQETKATLTDALVLVNDINGW